MPFQSPEATALKLIGESFSSLMHPSEQGLTAAALATQLKENCIVQEDVDSTLTTYTEIMCLFLICASWKLLAIYM